MSTKTREEVIAEIRIAEIDAVEEKVMGHTTLADLIRGGSKHTVQAIGSFGADESACALSAAAYAAVAAGIIEDA